MKRNFTILFLLVFAWSSSQIYASGECNTKLEPEDTYESVAEKLACLNILIQNLESELQVLKESSISRKEFNLFKKSVQKTPKPEPILKPGTLFKKGKYQTIDGKMSFLVLGPVEEGGYPVWTITGLDIDFEASWATGSLEGNPILKGYVNKDGLQEGVTYGILGRADRRANDKFFSKWSGGRAFRARQSDNQLKLELLAPVGSVMGTVTLTWVENE